MAALPRFASLEQYLSRLDDIDFWWPYLSHILGEEPIAGFNASFPTFICGDVVVKLFGYLPMWRASHAAERGALALVATDPEIAAPRLLGEGVLNGDIDPPWPYLIMTRVPGIALWRAELSAAQRVSVVEELGTQVRRVHALRPSGVATDADYPALDLAAAAARSSLPSHLVAQVDQYLAGLEPYDRVFVNGDIVANHVYVEDGRLCGVIDWGDAIVTDRHYELIQLYRDTFGCDKALLKVFLDASDWPVGADFPRRALGLALRRQAIGLAQHHTIDVFEPIAALLPLDEIDTLDELAAELFEV